VSRLKDELEQYLECPVEDVKDVLLWWVKNRAVYPRLSRMALDYLSIPGVSIITTLVPNLTISLATSVDVERVFSKGRIVLSHVQNGLSVQSTRALLCLGAWSALGLVEDEDVALVAKLADVDGCEADLDNDWDDIV
jgi:hypothetical protein